MTDSDTVETSDTSLDATLDRIEADVRRTGEWISGLRQTNRKFKLERPSWETDDDSLAVTIRRIEKIVAQHDANKHDAVLTIREAAEYARCTKPNGNPRDTFYAAVTKKFGQRKRVWRSEVDQLIADGLV
jgi:hypothetical protein